MKVILDIQRYNPENGKSPSREEFTVDMALTDRILDALIHVSRYVDGTLAFRKSCAHGVCGSDAMRINGIERLACKTLIQDVAKTDGDRITVDPLRHLPIQKDLMVDQSEFLAKFRSMNPYLDPVKNPPDEKEYLQSEKERALIDDATKCINCGACYSVCPVLDENPNFVGPAALVSAARFIYDSRDKGLESRLSTVDKPDGVWACDNYFECTKVCPRGIKITKLINFTKRSIAKFKEEK